MSRVASDDDAHVRLFYRRRALAADLLDWHARTCPICILRGARSCEFGALLAPIVEGSP